MYSELFPAHAAWGGAEGSGQVGMVRRAEGGGRKTVNGNRRFFAQLYRAHKMRYNIDWFRMYTKQTGGNSKK